MTRRGLITAGAAVALCITLPLAAQTVEEIAERSRQIRENASEIVGEDTAKRVREIAEQAPATYKAQVEEIAAQNPAIFQRGLELAEEMAGSQMNAARADGSLPGSGGAVDQSEIRYRIFISQAMPRGEVKQLVEAYAGRGDVALVLRGMLPGQKMPQLQRWIGRMLGEVKVDSKLPTLLLDPEPFTALGVDQVPVVARYADDGSLQAFALGSTSISFIEDAVGKGGAGNLGAFGPTVRVGEEDIIAAMKKRAASIDVAALKRGAIARYIKNTDSWALPRVTAPRTLELDPTFEVAQTISAPDGQVIAKQGERINPLLVMPFNQVMLFIDPADAEQVAWARAHIRANAGTRQVSLMASQVRSLGSLEGVGKLSDSLGTRVYLMPKAVKDKFHIEAVPTLVYAEGARFRIEEQLPSTRPGTR